MNYPLSVYSCRSFFIWLPGYSLKAGFPMNFDPPPDYGKGKSGQILIRSTGETMTSYENLIGMIFIVLTAAFILVFTLQNRRSRLPLRHIAAMERLARSIGQSVEDGRRIHLSFGRGNFLDSHAASAVTNMAVLKEVVKRSLGSDRPPAITSGDGITSLLAVDVLDSARNMGFSGERMDARRGRLAGVSPLSYAVGTLSALHHEQTSVMITAGMQGAELQLILDTAEDESVKIMTASDSPVGQAIAFSNPGDVLIGEEIFAMPAYLNTGSMYSASLLAEDALRWLLIIAIIIGSILQGLGISIV